MCNVCVYIITYIKLIWIYIYYVCYYVYYITFSITSVIIIIIIHVFVCSTQITSLYSILNDMNIYREASNNCLIYYYIICMYVYTVYTVTNPVHALLFAHHQRSPAHYYGLLHHTNCCTSPRTTVPIIHCTDDTHTAECTDYTHTADSNQTCYISHGLPLSHCRVLFVHITTLVIAMLRNPLLVLC